MTCMVKQIKYNYTLEKTQLEGNASIDARLSLISNF